VVCAEGGEAGGHGLTTWVIPLIAVPSSSRGGVHLDFLTNCRPPGQRLGFETRRTTRPLKAIGLRAFSLHGVSGEDDTSPMTRRYDPVDATIHCWTIPFVASGWSNCGMVIILRYKTCWMRLPRRKFVLSVWKPLLASRARQIRRPPSPKRESSTS
jgi:hypothetical protein